MCKDRAILDPLQLYELIDDRVNFIYVHITLGARFDIKCKN